mgnify:CR=1 FL=1
MSFKIKSFFLVFLLLCTSTLSGCLTSGLGPKFTQPITPEAGKAVIYVYRERVAMTGHEMPGIKMNDKEIAKVLPEISYFPISVEPGRYEFTPKLFAIFKTTPVTINAQAGQVYHVRFKVTFGHLQFAQVNKDEAMAYMATCYLLNPDYAVDPRVMTGGKAVSVSSTKTKSTPAPVKPAPRVKAPAKAVVQPASAKLFVEPVPANARIRILNIKPKFSQGIELAGGKYHVEVTASGYKKSLQWITLEAGETRQLQVALQPKQKPAAVKPVAKVAPKPTSQPKPAAVAVQPKRVINAPANVTAEEKRYAGMLDSESSVNIRNAAKNLYYRYSTSSYLASVAEQSLLQNYMQSSRDKMHVDAMAWLCKALARTGDSRFAATLQTVANNAPSGKLRKYAQKGLSQL